MTFGDYVKAIIRAGIMSTTRDEFAANLFNATGAYPTAQTGTVKSWIDKKAPNSYNKYFSHGSVKEDEFIRFLMRWTQRDVEKLQTEFRKETSNKYIDLETTDVDVFYRSMLNQFLTILKFPTLDDQSYHPGDTEPSKNELKAEIATLPPTPSVKHSFYMETKVFGRDAEMEKIDAIFENSNFAIITGIGGIGKSSLALAYAQNLIKNNDDYIVQHIVCCDTDTLNDVVLRLQFEYPSNFDKNEEADIQFEHRVRELQSSRKPTLIIFDNLNKQFTSKCRSNFRRLTEQGHVQFLITSRTPLVFGKGCIIPVEQLSFESLLEIYSYYRFKNPDKHKSYIFERKDILREMFERVGNHTLTIEMLAKLPTRVGQDEFEINTLLARNIKNLPATVEIVKDGIGIENTVIEVLKEIFSISNLTDKEIDIMRNMALIPPTGISKRMFECLTSYSFKEQDSPVESLKKSSWINVDEETFIVTLHPVIAEVIKNIDETKMTHETCRIFFQNLLSGLNHLGKGNHLIEFNEIRDHFLFKLIMPVMEDFTSTIETMEDNPEKFRLAQENFSNYWQVFKDTEEEEARRIAARMNFEEELRDAGVYFDDELDEVEGDFHDEHFYYFYYNEDLF